jgi:hypothetical protein
MPGTLIGTGLGMGLGFLVGGPLGMVVGGAIGGTAGGLFGPTRSGMAARSGGDVFLGVDDAGLLTITGARGKRWDQGGAVAEVQRQLDAINQQVAARNLTFAAPGQAAVGFGAASGSPRELSMTALVGQLRSDNANQMTAFGTLAGCGASSRRSLAVRQSQGATKRQQREQAPGVPGNFETGGNAATGARLLRRLLLRFGAGS